MVCILGTFLEVLAWFIQNCPPNRLENRVKRLIAAIILLGVFGLVTSLGAKPVPAQAQSSSTGSCQLSPDAYWSEEAIGRLQANYPFYVTSAIRKGADWKVLAVFHMMEHSLIMDNPANGQGFMQLYSYVKANPDAFPAKGNLSAEEAVTQLDLAYDEIQGKAKGKLTANPDLDTLYQAAAAYNGLGFHKQWQDHPYVVNDPPNGVKLKKPSRDGGPEDTISQQSGFKPLYESLSAMCPTGSALISSSLENNREAIDHCPALADPANVFPVSTDAGDIAGGSDNAGDWLVWTPGPTNQHHDYDAADIHAPTGTPVVSMTAGKVVDVREGEWSGKSWQPARLRVQSTDGCVTWYQHLLNGSVVVHEGDEVVPGQLLGQIGTPQDAFGTAPHLHIDVAGSLNDSQAARSREVCARDRERCQALTFDIQPVVAKLFLTQKVGGVTTATDVSQPPAPISVDQDRIPELESLLSLPNHSRHLVWAGLAVAFVLAVSTQFAPRDKRGRLANLTRVRQHKSLGSGKTIIYNPKTDAVEHEIVASPISKSARQSNPLLLSWDQLYSGMHFFLMGAAAGLIGLGLATHPNWKFRGLPLGAVIDWHIIGIQRALTEIPFWLVLPILLVLVFILVYGFFAIIAVMNMVFALITKGGVWSSVKGFWSPSYQWRIAKQVRRFLPTFGLLQLELIMLHWVMGVSQSGTWRIGWSIFLIAAPTAFHFHRQIFRFVGWLVAIPALLLLAGTLKLIISIEARRAVGTISGRTSRLNHLLESLLMRIFHRHEQTDESTQESSERLECFERSWEKTSS